MVREDMNQGCEKFQMKNQDKIYKANCSRSFPTIMFPENVLLTALIHTSSVSDLSSGGTK